MKRELPPHEVYYRPTRAGELREEAARLECRYQRLLSVVTPGWLATALGMLLWDPRCALLGLPLLLATGIGLGALVRSRQCREEADRLEAEHQARYGALPGSSGEF